MTSVRVVIFDSDNMLFIKRLRDDDEFYVIPGGNMEKSETSQQTALREVKEETNLEITLDRQLQTTIDTFEGKQKTTHYFLAKSWSGDLRLVGEELDQITETNKYELIWVPISQIPNLIIYPKNTYEQVLKPLLAARKLNN